MITRLFAWLAPVAVLAGCAAGSTLRTSDGGDTADTEPVSLAPTPAAEPESPDPYADPQTRDPYADPQTQDPYAEPAPQTAAAQDTGETQAQGYAPYGNSTTLDIRRIGQWTRTGIGEARRLVIKDANAWAQFWSELGVGDRPAVDFTRNVVVAAAAGQRPTGGHEIAIDRVTQIDGDLTVEVVERTPGPNCMTTASLTQPVDVVVVPASDVRGWSFMERKEIRGCR